MPKFLIEAQTDVYLRFVAECADEAEAKERGLVDFREGVLADLSDRDISIEVEQVPDHAPEGDA